MYNTYYNITLLNDTISSLKSDRVILSTTNTSTDSIMFGKDSSNNYGYIIPGADTVTPFKKEITVTYITEAQSIATAIIGEYYMCLMSSFWAGGGDPTDLIFTGANIIFCAFTPQYYLSGGNTDTVGSVAIFKATATSVSIDSSSKNTFQAARWYKLDY